MKDLVIMKITGRSVELFCKLNPSLEEFVTMEGKTKVLYVQLDKALYGCVKSALLWYETYVTTLKQIGFKINPYNMCVANAEIEGSQCTVCWYVDDNKISHMKSTVVDKVIAKIEEQFGKMSQKRGSTHEFLGMVLEYKEQKFTVSMEKHVQKAIDTFAGKVT